MAAGIAAPGVGGDALRTSRLVHPIGNPEDPRLPGVPGALADSRVSGTAGAEAVAATPLCTSCSARRALGRSLDSLRPVVTRTGLSGSGSRRGPDGAVGCAGCALASAGFGYRLRYFITAGDQSLGCVLLAGATRAVAVRDRWIGWTAHARRENVARVVNHSRFLIFPHVQVPHLARPGQSYHSTPRQVWVKPLTLNCRATLCAAQGSPRS